MLFHVCEKKKIPNVPSSLLPIQPFLFTVQRSFCSCIFDVPALSKQSVAQPLKKKKKETCHTDQTVDLNDAFMHFAIASAWQRTDGFFFLSLHPNPCPVSNTEGTVSSLKSMPHHDTRICIVQENSPA